MAPHTILGNFKGEGKILIRLIKVFKPISKVSKEQEKMNIVSAYKYLFYRIYVWQLGMFGEENNPKFVATLGNSIFIFINLMTLVVCFQIVTGYKIRVEKIHAVIGSIILFAINYFILLHNNKSQAIIAEFTSENEVQRKKRVMWCWVYVIVTHLSFFLSVLILSPESK